MKKIVGILLLFFAAGALFAQSTADLEVVVTADRKATEETDTTAFVSVITAEDIVESGAQSIVDILESLPGVQFRSTSGPANAQISMSGFGENSFGRVAVLLDGRLQNNLDMQGINWQNIPLDSIERIEVLHGGGSVLYGSGAVGGVVNIITKETDAPVSLEASGSYGSFMTHRESVSLGASNDLGSLQVGGGYFSTNAYRDRNASDSADATVAGTLYPTDALSFGLNLDLTRSFYEMPGGLTEAQFDADPTQAVNQEDEYLGYQVGTSVTTDYALGDSAEVELLLGYEYKNMAVDFASSGTFTDRLYNIFDVKPKFTWKSEYKDIHYELVSGIDLRSSALDVKTYNDVDRNSLFTTYDVSLISGGGYIDCDAALLSTLGISGGVRYDLGRITAENQDKSVDDYNDHNGIAWSAGLRWNPTESSKVYLRHERLFRYPFTDEQAAIYGYGSDAFYTDLEAEHGYLYEVGGYLASENLMRLDLRTYMMDMINEIAYNSDTGLNENLDNTRRLGIESTLTVMPVKVLKIATTYGYVLPYFTNGSNDGKQIPLVSNHELEGSVKAYLPSNLTANVDAEYRSSYYKGGDNANSQPQVDGYLLVNAGMGWTYEMKNSSLTLNLVIENILDVSYSSLSYYSVWSGNSSYYPGQGRAITFSGSYKL